MIVKIIKGYDDAELERFVKENEEFTVSVDRGMILINARVAEMIGTESTDVEAECREKYETALAKLEADYQLKLKLHYMTDEELSQYAAERKVNISKAKSKDDAINMLLK